MAATITITTTSKYIVFENSEGSDNVVSIPKENLTILQRTDKGDDTEYVYLNWGAGQGKGNVWHKDFYKLTYDQVKSPAGLVDNDGLRRLLEGYCDDVSNDSLDAIESDVDDIKDDAEESKNDLNKLSAKWGSLLIDDTDPHGIPFYAFYANEDTVINYINEDGVARADLAGASVYQGATIFAGLNGGTEFTAIELVSGSVIIFPNGAYTTTTTTTTT